VLNIKGRVLFDFFLNKSKMTTLSRNSHG